MTNLSEAQARELIAPWYGLFNVATGGDVRAAPSARHSRIWEIVSGRIDLTC